MIITLLILAFIIAVPFIAEARKEQTSGLSGADVISENPKYVSIQKILSGTGTLEPEEAEKVQIVKGLSVTEYLVSNNEEVKAGDPLARIDKASVMVAIAECQEKMERLEQEMDAQRNWTTFSDESIQLDMNHYLNYRTYTAHNDTDIHEYVYSPVSGVLTARYAEKGDRVRDVLLEHGCLAVVTFDNGYEYKVTAANGDVNYAFFSVGDEVKAGAALFYLENCTNDAQVEVLAKKHRKLEEAMEILSKLYVDGVVTAPCDGIITGIDEAAASQLETKNKNAHVIQADVLAFENPGPGGMPVGSVSIAGKVKNLPLIPGVDVIIETVSGAEVKVPFEDFYKYTQNFADWELRQLPVTLSFLVDSNLDLSLAGVSLNFNNVEGVEGSPVMPSVQTEKKTESKDDVYAVQYTTIMSVTPQNEMKVSIAVDELDILNIKAGMETTVSLDAFPGHSYHGTITNIDTAGSNNGGNSKYKAVVVMEREPSMIAGMNASVIIPVETYENVLAIPAKAIVEKSGKSFVYTEFNEKAKEFASPVEIETGFTDGENVQILSGLTENDTVKYTYVDQIDIDSLRNSDNMGKLASLLG